jgi:hypothetical protein
MKSSTTTRATIRMGNADRLGRIKFWTTNYWYWYHRSGLYNSYINDFGTGSFKQAGVEPVEKDILPPFLIIRHFCYLGYIVYTMYIDSVYQNA